jgi:hypothetical protein
MDQTFPFYSTIRGIGAVDVYHTHPACQIARSITLADRIVGIGSRRPECALCVIHRAVASRPAPQIKGTDYAPTLYILPKKIP